MAVMLLHAATAARRPLTFVHGCRLRRHLCTKVGSVDAAYSADCQRVATTAEPPKAMSARATRRSVVEDDPVKASERLGWVAPSAAFLAAAGSWRGPTGDAPEPLAVIGATVVVVVDVGTVVVVVGATVVVVVEVVVVAASGVTDALAAEVQLEPFAFSAVTVNVYAVPAVSPVTVQLVSVEAAVQVAPPGAAVTVEPVIAEPLSEVGAVQLTSTSPSPAVPTTDVGGRGMLTIEPTTWEASTGPPMSVPPPLPKMVEPWMRSPGGSQWWNVPTCDT
jgi:hypothetical protein